MIGIGIVVFVGIVVNNVIVFIDIYNCFWYDGFELFDVILKIFG